jgi:hypothetical protein
MKFFKFFVLSFALIISANGNLANAADDERKDAAAQGSRMGVLEEQAPREFHFWQWPETALSKQVRYKTVASYGSVLTTVEAILREEAKNPLPPNTVPVMLLTDWDHTITQSSSDYKALRDDGTLAALQQIQGLGIPVMVLTAKWHGEDLDKFVQDKEKMESDSGIALSTQPYFKNLRIDLRKDAGLESGLVLNWGIFAGNEKDKVLEALLNHASFPKARHYIIVDDDVKQNTQIGDMFRRREERATLLYYPACYDSAYKKMVERIDSVKPTIEKISDETMSDFYNLCYIYCCGLLPIPPFVLVPVAGKHLAEKIICTSFLQFERDYPNRPKTASSNEQHIRTSLLYIVASYLDYDRLLDQLKLKHLPADAMVSAKPASPVGQ